MFFHRDHSSGGKIKVHCAIAVTTHFTMFLLANSKPHTHNNEQTKMKTEQWHTVENHACAEIHSLNKHTSHKQLPPQLVSVCHFLQMRWYWSVTDWHSPAGLNWCAKRGWWGTERRCSEGVHQRDWQSIRQEAGGGYGGLYSLLLYIFFLHWDWVLNLFHQPSIVHPPPLEGSIYKWPPIMPSLLLSPFPPNALFICFNPDEFATPLRSSSWCPIFSLLFLFSLSRDLLITCLLGR